MKENASTDEESQEPKKVSLPDLHQRYRRFNKSIFNGKLPNITISLGKHKTAAAWVKTHLDRSTNKIVRIEMFFQGSLKMTSEEIDRILIHEMIHVKMMMDGHFYEDHGPIFQKEKKRIESMGYDVSDTHSTLASMKDGRDLIYAIITTPGGRRYAGALMPGKEAEIRSGAKDVRDTTYKGSKVDFYRAKHSIGYELMYSRSLKKMSYYDFSGEEIDDMIRSGKKIGSVEGGVERKDVNEMLMIESPFEGSLLSFFEAEGKASSPVDVTAYHATKKKFDPKRPKTPLFLADDKMWVRSWGDRIIKYRVKFKNPMVIENAGMHIEGIDEEDMKYATDLGHDGVVIKNDGLTTIYLAFKAEQLEFVSEEMVSYEASKKIVESSKKTFKIPSSVPKILYRGISGDHDGDKTHYQLLSLTDSKVAASRYALHGKGTKPRLLTYQTSFTKPLVFPYTGGVVTYEQLKKIVNDEKIASKIASNMYWFDPDKDEFSKNFENEDSYVEMFIVLQDDEFISWAKSKGYDCVMYIGFYDDTGDHLDGTYTFEGILEVRPLVNSKLKLMKEEPLGQDKKEDR